MKHCYILLLHKLFVAFIIFFIYEFMNMYDVDTAFQYQ